MVHFKDLLIEKKYHSHFDVNVKNGIVTSFKSDFGNETMEEIQKMVNVLIRHEYLELTEEEINVAIPIDVIDDDDEYYLETYHNIGDDSSEYYNEFDSVVLFDQDFLDEILLG